MIITSVLPFVNLTGGVRVMLDYANRLHDEGHDVTVVYRLWPYRFHFTRGDQLSEFRRQLRMPARVEWFDLRCRLLRVPFIANTFLPRADLVLATSWPVAHDVAGLDRSRGKKIHILFHHESGTGPEERIRATYALPFHRISFSTSVRRLIEDRFACEIHDVVPAGVDTSLFFPDGAPAEPTVLMLYHDDPRKGAADGIAALTRVRDRVPRVSVQVCGTVRPRTLPDWMRFTFHPSDRELRRVYSTATVFLYPSRDEGFGLPPLEAMACGCPVVTTDVGAVSEFCVNRCNALVVSPSDVDGLARSVEELLANAALRSQLSARGLETANRYALAHTAPLFSAALSRALQRS